MFKQTCLAMSNYSGWNLYKATLNEKPNTEFYVCTHLPASNALSTVVAQCKTYTTSSACGADILCIWNLPGLFLYGLDKYCGDVEIFPRVAS